MTEHGCCASVSRPPTLQPNTVGAGSSIIEGIEQPPRPPPPKKKRGLCRFLATTKNPVVHDVTTCEFKHVDYLICTAAGDGVQVSLDGPLFLRTMT